MKPTKILFRNAYVYTDNNISYDKIRHIAVEDGRIACVTDDLHEVSSISFDSEIDLGNRAVLPAFTDSHIHLLDLSMTLSDVDLEQANSEEEAAKTVADANPNPKPGEWIIGCRWAHNFWKPPALPTAKSLDKYFPNNPVILTSKCGHVSWCNKKALQAAGVYDNQPEIEGGKFDIDPETGKALGTIKENAISVIFKAIPKPSTARKKESLTNGIRHLHSFGILNVHNVESSKDFEIMLEVEKDGGPPIRVYNYFNDLRSSEISTYKQDMGQFDRSFAVGKKIFTDGSLGGRTAYMIDHYENEPDNFGISCITPEELGVLIVEAETHNLPCAIHAIGDAAVRFTLEQICEKAGPQFNLPKGRLPHRIEHLQLFAKEDLQLYEKVRPVSSSQPIHLAADLQPLEQFWGTRSRFAYAFKSVLNMGGALIFGSDAPVESPDPFLGIAAALTRQDQAGYPELGFYPQEKLTLSQSIDAYSSTPASVVGEEKLYGKIAPGMSADFVVLRNQQPAEKIAPQEWNSIKVDSLFHKGKSVFTNNS